MSTPESPTTAGTAAPAVSLRSVTKRFGDVQAVAGVDLEIADGEFFSLLGPSGSGKTTVLRMIAGFERPTSGRIELGGVDVTERPPFDRDVNTVFQDYALFPHMSVVENVAYGLRVRGTGKAQRRKTAEEALAAVALEGYADRRPSQLSGGQRQRVALARALVNRPRVLLLDEPLGALDLKLRQRMQVELKAIQRDAGITFVFVTHDQEEALTMSDRIAVFDGGLIEQVGTGADLYERPATPFVAGFVGTTNLVEGPRAERLFGAAGTWSLRPEHIDVQPIAPSAAGNDHAARNTSRGTVREALYLGTSTRLVVDTDGDVELLADVPNLVGSPAPPSWVGRHVALEWSEDNARRVSA